MPPNTIYVGRPTIWGNPFKTAKEYEDFVVRNKYLSKSTFEAYQIYLIRLEVIKAIKELRGKNLACWCPLDKECHADILLKLANKRRAK